MKLDLAANFATSLWVGILTLVFTPVYVHYLGVEAYGLIGLLAALQNSLGQLDASLGQMLSRELARFTGGGLGAKSARDLVRTVEVIAFALALAVVLTLVALKGPIAHAWLRPDRLPLSELEGTIPMMAIIVALRVLEGLYRGAVVGIGQQLRLNVITATSVTLKAFGALLLFHTLSRGVTVFFTWQALVSALNVGLLIWLLHASLPETGGRARFSTDELRRVMGFGAGLMVISLLAIALSQSDKLLLSKLLPLPSYGEYALSATLAAAPHLLAAPILQASQPRFARALAAGDRNAAGELFHASSQLMTVLLGSGVVMLVFFAADILSLWLANADLAARVSPVMRLIAIGNLFYALVWLPNALQIASGATGLIVRTSAVSVAVLIPALLTVAPLYLGFGAAWVWLAVNFAYFAVIAIFMFRTLLQGERGSWLVDDIGRPLGVAIAVAGAFSLTGVHQGPVWWRVLALAVTAGVTLAAAAAAAPLVRAQAAALGRQAQSRLGGSL